MDNKLQYTPSKTQKLIVDLIKANEELEKNGQVGVSLVIEGQPGVGKTSITKEAGKDLNYNVTKINIAQMTEPAELVGYFCKLYEVSKGELVEWIPETLLLNYNSTGWTMTGKAKTKPAPPDWVVEMKENTILMLDDYNRGNSLMVRAVMELMNEKTIIGWTLPKNTFIIATSNPDSGEFNVTNVDTAESSRSAYVYMKWSVEDWADMAERENKDSRVINFVLSNQEYFEDHKKDGLSSSNQVVPRMMDKFFSLVSTIPDFSSNMLLVKDFGEATVGSVVTNEFIKFVNNKLDKLPTPKELLDSDVEDGLASLTKVCGDYKNNSAEYNSATASILALRFVNYVAHNTLDKKTSLKLGEYMTHTSFTEDLKMMMTYKMSKKSSRLLTYLLSNPKLTKYITQ